MLQLDTGDRGDLANTPTWLYNKQSVRSGIRDLLLLNIEDPVIKHVYQLVQLGRYEETERALAGLSGNSDIIEHVEYIRALMRRIATQTIRAQERACLIWQYDAFETWEGQYIRELFADSEVTEIFDYHSYKTFSKVMFCVENRLGQDNYNYIRSAVAQGSQVILIHFGDEAYADDCSIYPWCRIVFRNHWSPLYSGQSNVRFLPLGYKSGFARPEPIEQIEKRVYNWSFCGDIGKSTRAAMHSAMASLENGYIHLTSGWDAEDALSVSKYRSIMDQSIFIPCPMGYCTPDSFRIYEALEAGCIPIIERGQNFDYFTSAFGDHPLIAINQWVEAPLLVRSVLETERASQLAGECHAWWQVTKRNLRQHIAALARGDFSYHG